MASGWIVYHPRRRCIEIDDLKVYCDSTEHNQDPYIWNTRFLHSFCHITQMSPGEGDLVLWVSGDTFPGFSHLYCDLVFSVQKKVYWLKPNAIERTSEIVETDEAFNDHFRWHVDHPFKKRPRYTLKADSERSFQAQNGAGDLIDIVPVLETLGIGLDILRPGLRAGISAKPLRTEAGIAAGVAAALSQLAPVRLLGPQLRELRLRHPELASA